MERQKKTEYQHIDHILSVLAVTDDYDEAKNFLDCYKTAHMNLDWDQINQIIAEKFPALIGYDAVAVFTYPMTAIHSKYALGLGAVVAGYGRELSPEEYEIKVMFVRKGAQ